jgi:hypothetical protein
MSPSFFGVFLASRISWLFLNLDQILARHTDASQNRLIPTQRPGTSRAKMGLDMRALIQACRLGGICACWPFCKDTDVMRCDCNSIVKKSGILNWF